MDHQRSDFSEEKPQIIRYTPEQTPTFRLVIENMLNLMKALSAQQGAWSGGSGLGWNSSWGMIEDAWQVFGVSGIFRGNIACLKTEAVQLHRKHMSEQLAC